MEKTGKKIGKIEFVTNYERHGKVYPLAVVERPIGKADGWIELRCDLAHGNMRFTVRENSVKIETYEYEGADLKFSWGKPR